MITENRPGAGQAIGSAQVAQSPANGQTLLLVTVSYTTNAAIYTKLPYDPVNALEEPRKLLRLRGGQRAALAQP